jgi:single-stranded DNA-specific DHH superfamily exonuclease
MLDRHKLGKMEAFLTAEGKKYLYFHRDQDGTCAAALFMKFYGGFTPITKKGPRFTEESIKTLIRKRPDLVVFLDLPVDQEWKALDRFRKEVPSARIIIIDHHVYEKDMNSDSVVHVNPLFKRKVYQSASYLVYRILKQLHGDKVRRFCWISMIGAIGDFDLKNSGDLVKECRENFPHLLGDDPHKSELAKGSKLLGDTITKSNWKGALEALEVLVKAENFDDFSSVKKFRKYSKEVDREFARVIRDAKREELPDHNLLILDIESDLSMVSNVSNYFSQKYPDRVIIVMKKSDVEWKMSIRFQNGHINLGSIAKRASKGIGSGGGHPRAAAALVSDWDEFKKRFLKELEKSL